MARTEFYDRLGHLTYCDSALYNSVRSGGIFCYYIMHSRLRHRARELRWYNWLDISISVSTGSLFWNKLSMNAVSTQHLHPTLTDTDTHTDAHLLQWLQWNSYSYKWLGEYTMKCVIAMFVLSPRMRCGADEYSTVYLVIFVKSKWKNKQIKYNNTWTR